MLRYYDEDDDAEEEDDEYFEDGQHRTITNHKDGYIEVRWVPIDASAQDFEATTLQICADADLSDPPHRSTSIESIPVPHGWLRRLGCVCAADADTDAIPHYWKTLDDKRKRITKTKPFRYNIKYIVLLSIVVARNTYC